MSDLKTKRFEMVASERWVSAVDDWRRAQPDLPSRAEAIRRLVETGLQGGGADAEAPTVWDLLAALYEADPQWRENYGWENKPNATVSEVIESARASARKGGLIRALQDYADLDFNEGPAAERIKALLARVDPEAPARPEAIRRLVEKAL